MERTKMGPHRHHYFQLLQPSTAFTHVRISIFPGESPRLRLSVYVGVGLLVSSHLDGGIKRLRVFGRSAMRFPSYSALTPISSPGSPPPRQKATVNGKVNGTANGIIHGVDHSLSNGIHSPEPTIMVPKLPAIPLTPDAFSPYGSVIQSYPDHRCARKDIIVTEVNFGTAFKFNHLSPVTFVQPPFAPGVKGEANFCVFRCDQQNGTKGPNGKEQWPVKVLERHEFSSQAFVPMGGGGGRYLVLVALAGVGP